MECRRSWAAFLQRGAGWHAIFKCQAQAHALVLAGGGSPSLEFLLPMSDRSLKEMRERSAVRRKGNAHPVGWGRALSRLALRRSTAASSNRSDLAIRRMGYCTLIPQDFACVRPAALPAKAGGSRSRAAVTEGLPGAGPPSRMMPAGAASRSAYRCLRKTPSMSGTDADSSLSRLRRREENLREMQNFPSSQINLRNDVFV